MIANVLGPLEPDVSLHQTLREKQEMRYRWATTDMINAALAVRVHLARHPWFAKHCIPKIALEGFMRACDEYLSASVARPGS